MGIKQDLENRLKDAMRANDATAKSTIRLALTSIKLAEVEKGGQLDETALLALLQKELKSRRESIEDAKRANRPDLIAAAEDEMKVISTFLPKQLDEAELEKLVREAVVETGAQSPSDMGKVMKVLLPRIQGRIGGDQVSKKVKELLTKSE